MTLFAATELPRRYRGVRDHEFFRLAQEDGRVVVTENVRDFATLVAERASRAESHCGVVFAVRPAFVRSHPGIVESMTRVLTTLLSAEPEPGAVAFLAS
ncbi:MAG: DUF5615 family PIN-like protein [Actinomycetota bacterium]|nr:DUF5615 family PIN-like protein [Actinomycetota bacterium]